MIDKGEGNREQKDRQRYNLRQVIAYCENQLDCRRQLVLAYFGENFDKNTCKGTCDNCKNDLHAEEQNIIDHVRNIVSLVKSLQKERVTLLQCVDIYRGMKGSKIINAGFDELEMYGKGNGIKRTEVERIFHFMVVENILKEVYESNAMGFTSGYVEVIGV